MSATADCDRTEHSRTQIYFTLSCGSQNSSFFIGDLSISTVCSPSHSKLFLSEHWTAISMQLPRLGLAFNPISNKEKSIYSVKCKPGVWWNIPSANSWCWQKRLQLLSIAMPPRMVCVLPIPAQSEMSCASSSHVGSRSLLTQLLSTAAG